MPEPDPLITLHSLPVSSAEKLAVLLLTMLDRQSELQERLGMIGIDEHIGGRPDRNARAIELSTTPLDQLKPVVEQALDDISTSEREIEQRINALRPT